MMFLFLFLVFLITAASLWFHGLWNAAVTLINLIFAMVLATSLYEPICSLLEGVGASSWSYLLDFVVLWFLFFFIFTFLRLITDMLSRTRVKFDMPVEMAGRSILAIWCGWLMVCFTAFSLQMAPLNSETPLGAWVTPNQGIFMGLAPDRQWLRFMQSRSRGALSRGYAAGKQHPSDQAANVQAFDPYSEFPLKYRDRRIKYSAAEGMRQ